MEKNTHFGPATEIESIEDDSGRLIFARYENWFSPFYVKEVYGVFHRPGMFLGRPLELFNWTDEEGEEAIVFRKRRFYLGGEDMITAFYGYADESIVTIEIELRNGETKTMKDFSEGVFYYVYYSNTSSVADTVEEIRGYDDVGKLMYRKEGDNFFRW
ncbi:hypothetical protein [Isachenkonia alkalipeptolytica]|uniref:Uncharacterized protein n=1 Tax=Isachenkonia alkalipeptolytica TaxID=2565777 RepID=A0AA43XJ45_9CLOT|nr:hypothetical protein [Isachenkonia alkalipeptolytica]NBG87692.1 hypothetical protein [Isachenkonia alkalipeptolytica]